MNLTLKERHYPFLFLRFNKYISYFSPKLHQRINGIRVNFFNVVSIKAKIHDHSNSRKTRREEPHIRSR